MIVLRALLLAGVLGAPLMADTISVYFSGLIFNSEIPGISVGDSFSGAMTWESSGTVLGQGGGSVNYGFFQPNDGVTVMVDGFTFSGLSFLDFFAGTGVSVTTSNADVLAGFSNTGPGRLATNYNGLTLDAVAANFVGNLNFNPSNAIPDPFNISDLILPGTANDPTSIGVQLDNGVSNLFFNGYIDTVSATPEPSTEYLTATVLFAAALVRCHAARNSVHGRLQQPNQPLNTASLFSSAIT